MWSAIDQPVTSRVHRSITVDGYSHPSAVGRQVMSPTNFRPGSGAVKSRRIRSGAGGAVRSCRVSDRDFRRVIPTISRSRMIRATRLRFTT